ncbi:MAG: resuscitation-promoting factor [Actinobacteria bacterium]|nr:resuscitation-promoting factor [Actinomycetota bacterium]
MDGEVRTVSTWAGSVDGLLEAEGIELGEHDELAPGADTALTDGSVVVVRVAEPMEILIDGEPTTIWTTADSAAEVLEDLRASGREGSVVASSRSNGRDVLSLPLAIGQNVTIRVDGSETTTSFDGVITLRGALNEFGVTLSDTDEIAITAGDGGSVIVKVTRIVHTERTEVETIPFETETRQTGDLYKGETRVIQAGTAGSRTIVYDIVTVDGVETQTVEVSNAVTAEPVTRIVEAGTKARPVASTSSASSSSASSSVGSAPTSGVWAALAQCESGGNPTIVSANGLYHGLYQFSVATWASVGGSGLPSQASVAEQTMRAQILQARAGWGQWPACAAKLGLL